MCHLAHPSPDLTYDALVRTGAHLGLPTCWHYEGDFYFVLDEDADLMVRVKPDDFKRMRLDLCRNGEAIATRWTRAVDWHRLAEALDDLVVEARALA